MDGQFQRHFYYYILPTFYILTLALVYFTGVPLLQTIVAPAISREYGLLETTQHLLILAVIWAALGGLRDAQSPMEKLGYAGAMLLASVQFLEEINYGQHYLSLFTSIPSQNEAGPMSLHNMEGVSSQLKRVGDAVILFYFVLFPLLQREKWPAWLRFLAPPRLLVITVLCSVVVSKFLHFVSDNSPMNNDLITGVSEFRETFTYYFVLVYVRELARNRRWPGFGKTDQSILKQA